MNILKIQPKNLYCFLFLLNNKQYLEMPKRDLYTRSIVFIYYNIS